MTTTSTEQENTWTSGDRAVAIMESEDERGGTMTMREDCRNSDQAVLAMELQAVKTARQTFEEELEEMRKEKKALQAAKEQVLAEKGRD
ncbi:hypothetical protein BaRGS_00026609 [Batillaria attramentaria]|uniref:Uncharacterized protein n=1 Tax=Batillaria attramentaria TaxID=370345 RepID=A0ABD0K4Y1_9CAEN